MERERHDYGLDQLEYISADNTLYRAAESGRKVRNAPVLIAVLFCAPWNPLIRAADFSTYRGFQLGMSLTEAAQQADRKSADARTIYQRPALTQEMNWAPRSPGLSGNTQNEIRSRIACCAFIMGGFFKSS